MPKNVYASVALSWGLALVLTLSGCGGDPETTEPDAAAADAPETERGPDAEAEAGEGERPERDLADPLTIAPENLCTVLSEETLNDLLGEEDTRSDPQGSTGVPDPDDLDELDRLRMSCMLVSAAGGTIHFSMEVHEGLYVDSTLASYGEEDADPDVDLGEFAVTGEGIGDGAGVTVVDGQVLVEVTYDRMGEADQDELSEGALRVAEEIMASMD